jgi:hypothetical protein
MTTAVQWLAEKLWVEFRFAFSNNILEQALEMEKQQNVSMKKVTTVLTQEEVGAESAKS